MRLSEVLSRPISTDFAQVEGFLRNQRLGTGKNRRILIGKVALNYYCKRCLDGRTFFSDDELYCIGVNDHLVSIDVVMHCPICETTVQAWFLVESEDDIFMQAPYVRIIKRSEKLSDMVFIDRDKYDDFSELLEKSQRAYRDGLGAGSIIYLRKILERATEQAAIAAGIDTRTANGKRKTYKALLEEVDRQCQIIPNQFAENGYRLFSELSEIIHGSCEKLQGLQKFEALYRLVVGVLDNIINNQQLMNAIGSLGWDGNRGVQQ